ncbi:MAG: CocE/NonD family hydrolase [Acidobacteria bacterium]|nr:CocE/NonD family hydrolase [Acidobacteriota bacterium]
MNRRRIALLAASVAALGSLSVARADIVKHTDVRFTMSDGVQVAADVYLPAGPGPFPCLVELTPYRKESRAAEGASYLPGEGFGLIEVDARGTGGSAGEYDIVFSMREQRDAAEVIEQVATTGIPGVGQACLPAVGMYGGSYSGIIQYLVASLPAPYYPEHLAAIAPQRAFGDLYRDIVYHGGMAIGSFGQIWSAGTQAYYTEPPTDVTTPVGQAAWTDHLTKNDPILQAYLATPYIDGVFTSDNTEPAFTQRLYLDSSILARIENLKVPALHLAGWFDAFTRGQMLTFQKALEQERADPSARGPNFLIVGPWNHSNTHFINPDQGFKQRLADWYRTWLVGGAQPGWMTGPRVNYYLMGTGALLDATGEWRDADSWPLPGLTYERYYLHTNGALSATAPLGPEPADSYVYDPAAGTGELVSRWDNAAVPTQLSWDQRTDEPKGLSYTVTFDRAARVAGTINLHLRATTIGLPGRPRVNGVDGGLTQLTPPYLDTDFVVKISDVAPAGTATLITQGYLRASHRDLDLAASEVAPNGDVLRAQHFDDSGHVSPPLEGADTTYDIEIWPTAKTFQAGHGLRLDIYSADTPGHLTLLEPVINTVLHSAGAESYLTVPVLPI